jgi:hypothetical protein
VIRFLTKAALANRGVMAAYLVSFVWLLLSAGAGGNSGVIGPLVLLFFLVPAAIGRSVMTFDDGGFGEIVDAARGYRWSLVYRFTASILLSSPVLVAAVVLCLIEKAPGSGTLATFVDALLGLGGCLIGTAALATLTHPNFPGSLGSQVVGYSLLLVVALVSQPFLNFLADVDKPDLTSSLIVAFVGLAVASTLLVAVPPVLRRR